MLTSLQDFPCETILARWTGLIGPVWSQKALFLAIYPNNCDKREKRKDVMNVILPNAIPCPTLTIGAANITTIISDDFISTSRFQPWASLGELTLQHIDWHGD